MTANPAATAHPHSYRGDIDGLRAIAVTSVVLFHAGLSGLSGGYVGVDIFFVISGFLIGGIVDDEIAGGRFSFVSFYVRRARRILPALIALTLLVLAFGLLVLAPYELETYAKSGVAALVGLANVRFYRSGDYFAPDAHFDPFLMTWSLGVEEQFYVVLPPLLLLLHRFAARWRLAALVAISLVSLAICILVTDSNPRSGFYMLHARAWEMGLGVILGIWMRRPGARLPTGGLRDGLALLGLAALIYAILVYDDTTAFPGSAALVPVLGSAALIATPGSLVSRALAVPPMRLIGLLSYSWYLYHWPFMAFARILSFDHPSTGVLSLMALLSLIAAWLSWRFVEQPFRRGRATRPVRTLLGYGAAVTVLGGVLLAVAFSGGLPGRLPGSTISVKGLMAEERGVDCLAPYHVAEPVLSTFCRPQDRPTPVALLGDSHAAALQGALRDRLARQDLGLVALTKSSCPAFTGITRDMGQYPQHGAECARFNRAALALVLADPGIETVVLAGLWRAVTDPAASDRILAVKDGVPGDPVATGQEAFAAALEDMLRQITGAGKSVIVLGDAPLLRFDPVRQLQVDYLPLRARLQRLISSGSLVEEGRVSRAERVRDQSGIEATIRATVDQVPGAEFRPIIPAFCDDTSCKLTVRDGKSAYVDSQHLSRSGAGEALRHIGLF